MRAFHSRYTEKCCRRGKRLQNQLSQDISTKLEPFFFFFFVWCELFALNNLRVLLKIYVLFFWGWCKFSHLWSVCDSTNFPTTPGGHDPPIGAARECNFPRAAKTTNCKHVVGVLFYFRVILCPKPVSQVDLRWSRSDSPRYPDCGGNSPFFTAVCPARCEHAKSFRPFVVGE